MVSSQDCARSEERSATRYLSVCLPSGQEYVVTLTGEDVTVGKAEKNSVVVDDPAVSSTHALFRRVGGEWMVVDLASRNGVFVNHHKIAGSCMLGLGDVVQIGHCRLALKSKYVGSARAKREERSGGKGKKKNVKARATWIKVSGAILAKIIGPLETILLGLIVSGHFLLSCGPRKDSGERRPTEQRSVLVRESAALTEQRAALPSNARHHEHHVR